MPFLALFQIWCGVSFCGISRDRLFAGAIIARRSGKRRCERVPFSALFQIWCGVNFCGIARDRLVRAISSGRGSDGFSETDPDARSMATSGCGRGTVGSNVQIAVEPTYQPIVDEEVTNVGNDREHLATMATKGREAIGSEKLTAVADRGYCKGEEILACEESGVTTYPPRPQTSGNQAKGLFRREDFRYLPQANAYRCPAGERLIWRFRSVEGGKVLDTYWSSACPGGAMHDRCTTGKHRRIKRWEHEAVRCACVGRRWNIPSGRSSRGWATPTSSPGHSRGCERR